MAFSPISRFTAISLYYLILDLVLEDEYYLGKSAGQALGRGKSISKAKRHETYWRLSQWTLSAKVQWSCQLWGVKKINDEDGEAGTRAILEAFVLPTGETDFYSKDDGQPLWGCRQGNDMLR